MKGVNHLIAVYKELINQLNVNIHNEFMKGEDTQLTTGKKVMLQKVVADLEDLVKWTN